MTSQTSQDRTSGNDWIARRKRLLAMSKAEREAWLATLTPDPSPPGKMAPGPTRNSDDRQD